MNINSKMASVAIVSAIAGASFIGANTASAHSGDGSLVSRIAERFGVSETEVQEVVDELKEERQAEREAARAEHLDALVADGTLTAEQRAELEVFDDKRQAQREELKAQDLTKQEVREAMEALRDEVEAWAESEGVDLDSIRPERDGEHRRGHHRGELKDRLSDEFGEDETTTDDTVEQ